MKYSGSLDRAHSNFKLEMCFGKQRMTKRPETSAQTISYCNKMDNLAERSENGGNKNLLQRTLYLCVHVE